MTALPIPFLFVGLGNPGDEYAATRHNIGFMAVDHLAEALGATSWKKKFKGLVAASGDFIFLKPQTYMNLSGEAVGEALRFYKLTPAHIVVWHDDLDLQAGQVRIKQGGGSGGHNGIKSLDAHIGPNYWRIRLGIGHPGQKGDVVTNYVLGSFAKADKIWLDPLMDKLVAELDLLLKGDMPKYQMRVTQHTASEKKDQG